VSLATREVSWLKTYESCSKPVKPEIFDYFPVMYDLVLKEMTTFKNALMSSFISKISFIQQMETKRTVQLLDKLEGSAPNTSSHGGIAELELVPDDQLGVVEHG
jgi:hypothetical protein